MNRRLRGLTAFLLLLLVVVAVQAVNIQFRRAPQLDASNLNPRLSTVGQANPRGEIVAADGTVLAESVSTSSGLNPYKRYYPLGSLTSDVVGFSSTVYGNWALEAQYNSYLTAHAQPAQSLSQLLSPVSAADTVTLTLQPKLQQIAQTALAGRDGSVVALDPRTGSVLALYSNPTFNPAPFSSSSVATQEKAWKRVNKGDAHNFPPLGIVATQEVFPPGSTFKVVTTAAAVVFRPDLLTKVYPKVPYITLPQSPLKLFNDGGTACGGDVAQMLPASCDPGYAHLGLDLGAANLTTEANAFGYNEVPPLDIPGVVSGFFPTEANLQQNPPFLAYSAIGQENVRATALLNALVASAIANGGEEMVPHLLNYVSSPDGSIVKKFVPTVWKDPLTPSQAAQIVPLMQGVVEYGTAAGIFFPADQVAAKTGTAQTGFTSKATDDWMIAFAPASNPTVAVAVTVPFQSISDTGAVIAGPVMKCVIEGALALQAGLPATGTPTTCSG